MRGDLLLVTTCSLSELYWFVLILTVARLAVTTVSHCWRGILAKFLSFYWRICEHSFESEDFSV